MKNSTITLWVNPECEMFFWTLLKILDDMPIENEYKWDVRSVTISKYHQKDFVCINLQVDMYLKFTASLINNEGRYFIN
jgi:hypothetical protein